MTNNNLRLSVTVPEKISKALDKLAKKRMVSKSSVIVESILERFAPHTVDWWRVPSKVEKDRQVQEIVAFMEATPAHEELEAFVEETRFMMNMGRI